MDSIINLQKKIVPELTDLLVQRYQILRQVSHEAPIGRRALAARLGLSERVLRAQVDFLKKSGLLDFSSSGMSVTDEGADILKELADYVRKLQDISFLESTLSDTLKIGKVVILPGDNVELQANTIATVLAQKLGASYRQLYVPDCVSEDILNSILKEDIGVRAVVDIIKQADILVHGVGRASVMARHRRLGSEVIAKLEADGAVGEAFGQYCALDGRQVYMTNNAGLMLQDLQHIGTIIGIAGGKSKAAAILSVIRASRQDILITDEAAAHEILKMAKEQ